MPPKKRIIKSDGKDENDVSVARGRLMGALQGIIGGSESESEESFSMDDSDKRQISRKSPVDTTKRKRREGATDLHQTYIMKLFDRSVDLAQFNENTPLYPVCRSWISNQPKLRANRRISKPEKDSSITDTVTVKREPLSNSEWNEEDMKDVYTLPAPISTNNHRTPKLLPEQKTKRQESNFEFDYDRTIPRAKESLLAEHLSRWVKVRSSWQKHSYENEKRYSPSAKVLTAIYNKAQENMG